MGLCGSKKTLRYKLTKYEVVTEKLLAEGGFSYVYLAHDAKNKHTKFALKQIRVQELAQIEEAKWEIHVHTTVEHPNLLPLLDSSICKAKQVRMV